MIFNLLALSALAASTVCNFKESKVMPLGTLSRLSVNEASGFAVSALNSQFVYAINDSGDGPYFYKIDLVSKKTTQVQVSIPVPTDTEALGYGPCITKDGNCLYLADIGDNYHKRDQLRIAVVKEQSSFPQLVKPEQILNIRYPDGAKDAESIAVAKNGDIYLLSKEADYKKKISLPSRLYRLPARVWTKSDALKVLTLEFLQIIDFTDYTKSKKRKANTPTDMSFDLVNNRWFILTYSDALVFAQPFDLNGNWRLDEKSIKDPKNISVIKLTHLYQQEALAYDPATDSLLYATEADKSPHEPEIMKVSCEKK